MILQWVMPLGFIGLLGIGALILIYILKPKYQNRNITSTYVWRLSLKYRKQSFPIDLFGHLLAFCCQALILIALALLLARPYIISKDVKAKDSERIIIIDSSASMHAQLLSEDSQGETRFERAINDIKMTMNDVLYKNDGVISVILADDTPEYIVSTAGKDQYTDIVSALDNAECSYGSCNMESALLLAQERLKYNPIAKVYVYSGTNFGTLGDAVTMVNLSDAENEWNIAILNCDAVIERNEYVFYIDVAAYGNVSTKHTLTVQIKGAINEDKPVTVSPLEIPVTFDVTANSSAADSQQRITVRATDTTIGGKEKLYFESYEEVVVEFRDLIDSVDEDNSIRVYGGVKDEIKIQYYSSRPNPFYASGFDVLTTAMRKNRKITFDKKLGDDTTGDPVFEGYDFYIFEHEIPEKILTDGLPEDGVILLFDPDRAVDELGLQFAGTVPLSEFTYFSARESHPLTQFIKAEKLGVSRYTKVLAPANSGFETLLYCGNDPVMLVRNTTTSKIVVLPFDINQSNFAIEQEFEIFLYNLINYFMPNTLTQSQFEIGDSVSVNCKGTYITVESGNGTSTKLTTFPEEFTFTELGTYTFTTTLMNKKDEVRKAFVKPPASESNIFQLSDLQIRLDNSESIYDQGQDIFFWIALVMVALLFVEWWLQFRKNNV